LYLLSKVVVYLHHQQLSGYKTTDEMKNSICKKVLVVNSEVEIYADNFAHAKEIANNDDKLVLRISECGQAGEIVDSIKDELIGVASIVTMDDYWNAYYKVM